MHTPPLLTSCCLHRRKQSVWCSFNVLFFIHHLHPHNWYLSPPPVFFPFVSENYSSTVLNPYCFPPFFPRAVLQSYLLKIFLVFFSVAFLLAAFKMERGGGERERLSYCIGPKDHLAQHSVSNRGWSYILGSGSCDHLGLRSMLRQQFEAAKQHCGIFSPFGAGRYLFKHQVCLQRLHMFVQLYIFSPALAILKKQ